MDFTYNTCEGIMYKRIEEVKIYHSSGWHKKYFRIVYEDSILQIYDSKKKIDEKPKNIVWL
jgi:hypothetical protein